MSNPEQGGFSLVELMVAAAVGLIGVLMISMAFINGEAMKRSALNAGGAQGEGVYSIATIERDVMQAGYGIAHSNALVCGTTPVNYSYNNVSYTAGGALPPVYGVPVYIETTGGQPDRISVVYGSAPDRAIPGTLQAATANSGTQVLLDNSFGFSIGDIVLVTQPGNCTLMQVDAINAPVVTHTRGTGYLFNPTAVSADAMWVFGNGATAFNLGARPVARTYFISNSKLVMRDAFVDAIPNGATGVAVASNIVDLKALYGKDDGSNGGVADDGTVDGWDNIAPANLAEWRRVLALRVAVLARSQQYDKPEPGAACKSTTTANQPAWDNGTRNFTFPETLPSCYSHRAFETVIPLRNLIWRQV